MTISDVLSDLTIEVRSTSFALHKFPLVSQSGRTRKLLLEAKDTNVSRINLTSGGSNAFELAVKFYYGVNVEITISNMVLLKCAARFIEMTEDIFEKNLEIRTECIDSKTPSDWWGKSLMMLNLGFFQRVLSAVKIKEKTRIIVKIIAGLLPAQSKKNAAPMAFLSSLLKSAIAALTSIFCKSDLERRIGLQLDQAILEDILIPANPHGNNHSPLYDIDSILRIFSFFLKLKTFAQEAKVYSLIALIRLLTYMQLLPHGQNFRKLLKLKTFVQEATVYSLIALIRFNIYATLASWARL
ncbi:hypothetical protein FXO37_27068 [Capsicum annuum]|nr:hypothetical protein FXO37_27068 [Capsicum annuum]